MAKAFLGGGVILGSGEIRVEESFWMRETFFIFYALSVVLVGGVILDGGDF